MSGPPYCVPAEEIELLFSRYGRLELLETCDVLDDRFRNKGLGALQEKVFQLAKK
jgi:hypothetical protein